MVSYAAPNNRSRSLNFSFFMSVRYRVVARVGGRNPVVGKGVRIVMILQYCNLGPPAAVSPCCASHKLLYIADRIRYPDLR